MSDRSLNFLCISTFFKGVDFLKRCKLEGNNVYLLTMKKLEHENWPHESLDDIFYIDTWNDRDISKGIAYKYRTIKFDRFVALDDFDVEKVASLREHFRMPGMGRTTSHYFRDKLAMRIKAKTEGLITKLKPLLDELTEKGVWISDNLKRDILSKLGE